uniref:Uncharacterized protein n=1 Tax=Vespula pensylvanica TaxID=30213 RepID=A0A834PFJ8_VESPE|nr:hypothetical protein H0235_001223 [Vespula pensylvanica]
MKRWLGEAKRREESTSARHTVLADDSGRWLTPVCTRTDKFEIVENDLALVGGLYSKAKNRSKALRGSRCSAFAVLPHAWPDSTNVESASAITLENARLLDLVHEFVVGLKKEEEKEKEVEVVKVEEVVMMIVMVMVVVVGLNLLARSRAAWRKPQRQSAIRLRFVSKRSFSTGLQQQGFSSTMGQLED